MDQLMKLVSRQEKLEVCEKKPLTTLQNMEMVISDWSQLKLMRYMNQDRLFTINYLRGLHPKCTFRSKAIARVAEFISQMEADLEMEDIEDEATREALLNSIQSDTEMPIWEHLRFWVRNVYVKSMEFERISGSGAAHAANSNPSVGTGTPASDKPISNKWQKTMVETVAAALINDLVAKGGEFADVTKPAAATTAAKKKFDCEVTRDMRVTCVNAKKQTCPYAATAVPCPVCSDSSKTKHKDPGCFMKQCDKCLCWGHATADCMQTNKNTKKREESANVAEDDDA